MAAACLALYGSPMDPTAMFLALLGPLSFIEIVLQVLQILKLVWNCYEFLMSWLCKIIS